MPMAKEILEAAGVYNPRKLTGVTTLDIVRANTFVSQMKGTKTSETYVPVIGGHSGLTILPLLSQTTPSVTFTDAEIDALSARIRDVSRTVLRRALAHKLSSSERSLGLLACALRALHSDCVPCCRCAQAGTEVVDAKDGEGSATLSTAYAGAIFAEQCLRGLAGEKDIVDYAYVDEEALGSAETNPGIPFFSRKCKFGVGGIEAVLPTGPLSAYEKKAHDGMLDELKRAAQKGVEFAHA